MTEREKIIEAMARAFEPMRWFSVDQAQGVHDLMEPSRRRSLSAAEAALTAIAEQGYAVVPMKGVILVHHVRGPEKTGTVSVLDAPIGPWILDVDLARPRREEP